MPFTYDDKSPGDLIKSEDWNLAMAAIVALFGKLDPTSGHNHDGTAENAPVISENGIADDAIISEKINTGAVIEAKLANNAVSSAKIEAGAVIQNKLADDSVSATKIKSNAVTTSKIQNNAVNTNKILNNAITGAKIQNGAVTLSKIASGVIPEIGIAVTMGLGNDTSIPIPTGFSSSECVFFAIPKWIDTNGGTIFQCNASSTGVVRASPSGNVVATGVAIAKKGGW